MTAPRRAARYGVAAFLAIVGVWLVVAQRQLRILEAGASAKLVGLALDSHRIGSAVIFSTPHRWVGYTLATGCTAAILCVPFFLFFSGAIVVAPKVPLGRAILTLGVVTAIVFAVNQLRLAVIASSLDLLGYSRGYSVAHVFLGTVVSTIGIVAGVSFLIMFLGMGRRMRHEERVS